MYLIPLATRDGACAFQNLQKWLQVDVISTAGGNIICSANAAFGGDRWIPCIRPILLGFFFWYKVEKLGAKES